MKLQVVAVAVFATSFAFSLDGLAQEAAEQRPASDARSRQPEATTTVPRRSQSTSEAASRTSELQQEESAVSLLKQEHGPWDNARGYERRRVASGYASQDQHRR